jgi:predicted metal-dependent enzyme (double-stranded beta helix superfamily)
MNTLEPLRSFVREVTECVSASDDEAVLIAAVSPLLERLIRRDDWLPESCARPHPLYYRQYLLHCDPLERFSVVSFVWGPGQRTPIHDHTVWGLVGMLRGAEQCQPYAPDAQGWMHALGSPHRLYPGEIDAVSPRLGDVHTVANAISDKVSISIHIYGANIGAVRRHVYPDATALDRAEARNSVVGTGGPGGGGSGTGGPGGGGPSTGGPGGGGPGTGGPVGGVDVGLSSSWDGKVRSRPFVSGYSSAFVPNLWNGSGDPKS